MVSIQAQDKDLGKIDVFCYKVLLKIHHSIVPLYKLCRVLSDSDKCCVCSTPKGDFL